MNTILKSFEKSNNTIQLIKKEKEDKTFFFIKRVMNNEELISIPLTSYELVDKTFNILTNGVKQ